ncbi:type I polyketide synthase [Nocardiopsis sp. NPDC049922]|uniref:type I polyketide synthase n=1 Tax=Nocardiopsis sp. NPDC049922 TaxID=3155157 RepID=UPI0033C67510
MSAPIAVTGLACRLPGDIATPEEFWDALVAQRDLITSYTDDHPRAAILPAALLSEEDQRLDAVHFGFSPTEVTAMDPQQKLLLELVDEAFQDAGMALDDWRGRRVGCWVGSSCLDQALLRLGPGQGGTMVDTAGAIPSMLSNRVCHVTNWRGPSETIDTACSASLVALHRARQALTCGEAELAVVGGVNLLAVDTHTRMFRSSRVLADDGQIRPFDTRASGFVRGEGAGVVILQPLKEAEAAGVRVRVLLVGSQTNHDGAAQPVGAPNVEGQRELLAFTYAHTPVDRAHVDYVETHGTGTRAGDQVEVRALGRELAADRDRLLWIGSVKPNVGHQEGAAGIISTIKTVLALEHGILPPTRNHTQPLPLLKRLGLAVPVGPRRWPHTGHPRTAAVQAFGFGGTNAHAVFQQAPARRDHTDQRGTHEPGPVLIPLSASSPQALAVTAGRWAEAVRNHSDLGAVAATAAHRRDHLPGARAAVVASTSTTAAHALTALSQTSTHPTMEGPRVPPPRRPRVVFVYSGHGGHPTCGTDLDANDVFADALTRAHDALAAHLPPAPVPDRVRYQTAQWAWQVAATGLLASWGITPDIVVGHSLGEVAAASTANVLSHQDAARLVCARARLLAKAAPHGGLVATDLDTEAAHALIADHPRTAVAALNAPNASVISGPQADLDVLAADLAKAGRWYRNVPEAPPAHSPLMDQPARTLTDQLAGLTPEPASVALWSTAAGQRLSGGEMTAAYWGRQLRDPVHLHHVLHALAVQDNPLVVVEVGARPVLSASLAATLGQARDRYRLDPPVIPLTREHADRTEALAAVGALYTFGVTPQWPTPRRAAVSLPLRAWTHTAPPDVVPGSRTLTGYTRQQASQEIGQVLTDLVAGALPEQVTPWGPDTDLQELGVGSLARATVHQRLMRCLPDLEGLPVQDTVGARTVAEMAQIATDYWAPACFTGE